MPPTDGDGRKPLISGNWKMHYNHLEAIQVVQKLSFPSASISTLDCGHWPHLERPDEVISLVTPFLAEQITGGR